MQEIKTITDLINSYKKLPGIGYRTAERLAYATLSLKKEDVEDFIQALDDAITKVKRCPFCGTFYDDVCPICSDHTRDCSTLLVIADSKDILTIEKTNGYHGSYFTLKGTLSPLKNRTPDKIGIPELKERVKENFVNNDSNDKELSNYKKQIVELQEALDKANADLEKINTEELQKLDEAIARLEAIINA